MEPNEFRVSRFSIIWRLTNMVVLAVFFLFFYLGVREPVLLIFAGCFIIWAVVFIRRPQAISIDENEIVFMSKFFKPIRINVKNLLSIEFLGAGQYIKFKSGEKSLTTLSKIKDRDVFFNQIQSLNKNIEIKPASQGRKLLNRVFGLIFGLFFSFVLIYGSCGHDYRNVRVYNSVAHADLKLAFRSAQLYFKDHPKGFITLQSLKKYGFAPSVGVEIQIISRTKNSLKISTKHAKGNKIYLSDAKGKITVQKKNRKL